jgi:thioredoxin 1
MKKVKVLFFSAPWCGGCTKMKGKFYETCRELGVDYKVLDVEEPEGLHKSITYSVRNVPTLIFISNGREVGRATGNESYKKISEYVGK